MFQCADGTRRIQARMISLGLSGIWLAIAAMAGTVLCAGCEVGPDYHPPKMTMPPHWQIPATTQASVVVQQPVRIERWWANFHDRELDSLIQRAVAANLDLQAATERIRQARATVDVVRGGLLPAANASGSYAHGGSGPSQTYDLWQAGLDASWELDIFGGTRRAVESARASFQAAIEDRRDVLVTLLGEVATDYIQLREYQQEIAIDEQNLQVQIHSVQVTRNKRKLGTGTELDVVQAQSIVATSRADLETLQAEAQQTIYAMSFLLGLPPAALDKPLTAPGVIPQPPPVVEVGVPSELLRRRPDIRRAERQVAAATAQIGVATADLFPKFFLTGDFNLQASNFSGLANWNNRSWSIGPSMTWPIFAGGQIRANIRVQNALQAQALTAYKTTILAALQEVQNAMVGYARQQRRREALGEAVTANQRAVVLATQRYNQGLTDFLSVLDAERSLFSSQSALVQSNGTVATDAVALYKTLGGGWEVDEKPNPNGRISEKVSR
jgi:NodT family efflux transporter outer membrane factor (OMF) lipoprotein